MNAQKRIKFDVLVIGAGHAGCEAFAAAGRIGVKVALLTPSFSQVAVQPCNPAVGGPGKGHLVREIAALGGLMGKVTDRSGLQFRTLNKRKGPAVRSTRVQTDSEEYVKEMMKVLASLGDSTTILEDNVTDIMWSKVGGRKKIIGVKTSKRTEIYADAVVVTTGTFLRGLLFIGDEMTPGGRRGAKSSMKLAQSLEDLGLPMIRLKTGTCPRLAGNSINYSALEEQEGDKPTPFFDLETTDYNQPQRSCYLTYTGEHSHDIIKSKLKTSALYGGAISGIGPRYCPSIETKIERFPDKERHQVFLEPEDKNGTLIYPSGLSTSLPRYVQEEMVHAIAGLENARIVKYGYAVEYDAFQPQCLKPSLEADGIDGLYLAGQILGTSGYEEAAAAGLVAGANAALHTRKEPPLVLERDKAYIGVMIDDLTGKGVDEPYRMFTSRAEYRLLLREDNADERLMDVGVKTGLIPVSKTVAVRDRIRKSEMVSKRLSAKLLTPSNENNNRLLNAGIGKIKKPTSLYDLARREGVGLENMKSIAAWLNEISETVLTRVEVEIKYSGYLERQQRQADRLREVDRVWLPEHIDYSIIPGLRGEIIEKLQRANPSTLGQASRIPGVTPAALEILRVYCQRRAASISSGL